FAAGMSGGIAYVLDLEGDFERRCNAGMVDLEALDDMDEVETVRDLLIRHHRFTQSTVAQRILANWTRMQARFVKVMPRDYKHVLSAIVKAKETGIPVDEAVMAAAHG
ncbi:MAG: hypothetical protein ACREV3_13065, partial [Gammaproteobacteria bacterium]